MRPEGRQFRRVVAFLIGGLGVLKRPCHCRAEQGERENAASKESFDPLFHVRSRIDPAIRSMTSL